MTLGPVFLNGLFKLLPGKPLQHLAANARYSYHGGVGPAAIYLWQRKTVAEFYPRRSKPFAKEQGHRCLDLGRQSNH
jgi:hypothetical protein